MNKKLQELLESYFITYGREGQVDVRYMTWCMIKSGENQYAYVWHFKDYYGREKACADAWKFFKDPAFGVQHATMIYAIFEVAFDKDFTGNEEKVQ